MHVITNRSEFTKLLVSRVSGNCPSTMRKVDEYVTKIEHPVIIDDAVYIPEGYRYTLDEEEAHLNGLIVEFMVRRIGNGGSILH